MQPEDIETAFKTVDMDKSGEISKRVIFLKYFFIFFINKEKSLKSESYQELKLAVKYLSKRYGLKDVSWIVLSCLSLWVGSEKIILSCLVVKMLKSLTFPNLLQTKIWEKLMRKVSLAIIFWIIVSINYYFSSPKRIKLVLTLQVDDGDGRLNYKEFEKMVQIAQKAQKNIED